MWTLSVYLALSNNIEIIILTLNGKNIRRNKNKARQLEILVIKKINLRNKNKTIHIIVLLYTSMQHLHLRI